ncbi:MAG: YfhO family protein [Atopobiaceae bacterium]|nr:YfhO family protein [Atopobiaceae bacterium]
MGYATAFLLPMAMLVLTCAWSDVYPLGSQSFLTEDLCYQYVDFFTWFRRVLLGDGSVFYTSALSLGTNAWGLVGYYLSSPLNLLVVLFDESHITLFVWVVCMLKLGLAGASMAFFVRRRNGVGWVAALACALAWSWSGWSVAMIRNPMWLDALYVLPVMCWGVHGLVRRGRWRLLLACFVYAVVSCWYTAYMLIIFGGLYAVLEVVVMRAEGEPLPRRVLWRRVAIYVGLALLGLGLSAWTFVPSVVSMLGGASSRNGDIFSNLFWGSGIGTCYPTHVLEGLFTTDASTGAHVPELFCGTGMLVMGLLYLLDRDRPRLSRVAPLVLAVFLLACICVKPLYAAWCGFKTPSGFFCRISFLLVFVILWCASAEMGRLRRGATVPPRRAAVVCGGMALIVVALTCAGIIPYPKSCVLSVLSAMLVLACLVALRRGVARSLMCSLVALTLAALVGEVAYDAYAGWSNLYIGLTQADNDSYVTSSSELQSELAQTDDGVYREDKTYTRHAAAALNESIAQGYMSISSYSSAYDASALDLIYDLGYARTAEMVSYSGTHLASDSLLGVKYVSSSLCPIGFVESGVSGGKEGTSLWRNPHALSLGFGVGESALSCQLSSQDGVFDNQNAFVRGLTGADEDVYVGVEPTLVSEDETSRTWSLDVPAGSVAYVYCDAPMVGEAANGCSCYVDGTYEGTMGGRFTDSMALAVDSSSETQTTTHTITFSWDADSWSTDGTPGIEVALLDQDALTRSIERVSSHQADFTSFEDGHIEATYTADSTTPYLLLTIPNDEGWTVTVNGEQVSTLDVCGGALMAIPVSEGENQVSMSYVSPGFREGCVVTGISGLVLVGLLVARGRKAHKGLAT